MKNMSDLYPSDLDETQDQATELTAYRKQIDFKTKLNFLLAHNGIRKNKMHFLIAPTHSGKSTLTRTILRDLIINNQSKKILVWLTEETTEDFKRAFYESVPAGEHLKNVKISCQVGVTDSPEKIMADFTEMIEHFDIDIVICDNITTSSKLYQDESIARQSTTMTWLKSLTKITTVFCIAHTNTSDFNNRLLDENDIRGGKTAVNLTEFLYVMQPIQINNTLHQFILIKKHRNQKVENKFFKLNYDHRLMAFANDYPTDFEFIKNVFKDRNKL